jgi:hypothetical protein
MEYDKQLNRSDLSLVLDNHINQTDHSKFEKSLIDLKNRLFNLEINDKIPEDDNFDLPTLRRQYTMVNGTGFILDMISTLNNKIIKLEKRMSKMGDKTNNTEIKYDL